MATLSRESAGTAKASHRAPSLRGSQLHGCTVSRRCPKQAGPPQATFAQLRALIEESRTAGMSLQAHIDLHDAKSLPPTLGRTAYRVVQEGLTNARKHAPGAPVTVTVTTNDRPGLLVEIISHQPARPQAPRTPPPGAGAGLVGLAEHAMVMIFSYLLAYASQIGAARRVSIAQACDFAVDPSVQEPGSVTMGINNSTSVAADGYDIVGRYVIDAVAYRFWATVLPRTTAETVQQDLDIQEYTDPKHNPMIPHALVLKPGVGHPQRL